MIRRFLKPLLSVIILMQVFGIVKLMDVVASELCISSFDNFAFQGPRQVDDGLLLPPSSWENEDFLTNVNELGFVPNRIEAIREDNNRHEIWLAGQMNGQQFWLIYDFKTEDVQIVSNELILESQTYNIGDLYVSSVGDIWGFVQPQNYYVNGELDTTPRPILALYDDTVQQFVFTQGVMELPNDTFPEIILDRQDNLWIVVANQGVYKFDTRSRETTQVIEDTDLRQPIAITFNISGSIIFQTESPRPLIDGNSLNETLYELDTNTDEVMSIAAPQENWPLNKGILVDQLGRLWLGANGFRDTDGYWNLIHSNISGYWENPVEYRRSTPQILLETSDGRLWFTNWWDGSIRYHGAAWYNPNTQTGCMFTNSVVSAIEDSEQNLWLVAGGRLYIVNLEEF